MTFNRIFHDQNEVSHFTPKNVKLVVKRKNHFHLFSLGQPFYKHHQKEDIKVVFSNIFILRKKPLCQSTLHRQIIVVFC